MKPGIQRLIFVAALTGFLGLCWFPISSRFTRAATVVCFAAIVGGLAKLAWSRQGLRWLVGVLALGCVLLVSVPSTPSSSDSLRSCYVAKLQRYRDTRYVWGGENSQGIDCSGLVRRSMIDALIHSSNPGDWRMAMKLWWRDCSARDLGDEAFGLTSFVTSSDRLSAFEHSSLNPGDLAITSDGLHVMAYIGERRWIEADPVENRVVIVSADDPKCPWMFSRMKLMRWRILSAAK